MERRGVFLVFMFVMLTLASYNTYAIYGGSYSAFPTAQSVLSSDIIVKDYNISLSFLAIVGQWILVIAIIFLVLIEFSKKKTQKKLNEIYFKIKDYEGKFGTDLDSLYFFIKENKRLKLQQVSRALNIPDEKALDLVKILENNNLISIEYPAFASPTILLKEKNEEE